MLRSGEISKKAIILVLFGIVGGILFFPIPIDSEYTCLFQRIFESDNPVVIQTIDHATDLQNRSSALLKEYASRFAIIWWLSLSAIAYGIFIKKKFKNFTKNETSIIEKGDLPNA